MIKIIDFDHRKEWDNAVRSVDNYDVYYLSGYVSAFKINGDGEPALILFEDSENKAICVVMKRDISNDKLFAGKIQKLKYFDMVTPYGYGGFTFNTAPNANTLHNLANELSKSLLEQSIISAFFRFHPVLNNAHLHDEILEVSDLGNTIAIDLSSPDVIWQNIISKNRNMIRKAEKNGVVINHGKGSDLLKTFKRIYDETMFHDNAEEYYFFKDEFYESIDRDLSDNYEIFYAEYEGNIIAMSIILFAGKQMHYHLSGSHYEYRRFAPSNLLLYKAALWGYEQGFKTFHLGGGVGSGEDNLYKFKAAFNRNSNYQFSIGKMIIDHNKYDELLKLRNFSNDELAQIHFFPAYRANV